MEIIKIIIEAVLGTVLLLALIVLIHAMPVFFSWLSEQIGLSLLFGLLLNSNNITPPYYLINTFIHP